MAIDATRQKPSSAAVLGILNILFGVLGLFYAAASLAVVCFFNSPPDEPLSRLMEQKVFYRVFIYLGIGMGFIAMTLLIIAGLGLLRMRSYGRTFSIVYGGYAVITVLITTLVNVLVVFPALLEDAPVSGDVGKEAGAYLGLLIAFAGGCFGLIYPAVLLFFMFRPSIIAAYRN